jgi:solute carrier family 20 (sodium-dependent phosphate transporter)
VRLRPQRLLQACCQLTLSPLLLCFHSCRYTWFIVVGAFAAFAFGFATGSNDVANAFATSVGSKTLTMRQAVLIAAVFEFVGALVLGRVSTSVIAKGVADVKAFKDDPEVYAYGMICALSVGAIWQLWASWAGYNVSATQSIIGAIVGFALVWEGADGIKWADKDDSKFPPYAGVLPIILSWFVAPLLTAIGSMLIFGIVRFLVLRRENGLKLSYYVLPPAVFITTWINMYFVFTKVSSTLLIQTAHSYNAHTAKHTHTCTLIAHPSASTRARCCMCS